MTLWLSLLILELSIFSVILSGSSDLFLALVLLLSDFQNLLSDSPSLLLGSPNLFSGSPNVLPGSLNLLPDSPSSPKSSPRVPDSPNRLPESPKPNERPTDSPILCIRAKKQVDWFSQLVKNVIFQRFF